MKKKKQEEEEEEEQRKKRRRGRKRRKRSRREEAEETWKPDGDMMEEIRNGMGRSIDRADDPRKVKNRLYRGAGKNGLYRGANCDHGRTLH